MKENMCEFCDNLDFRKQLNVEDNSVRDKDNVFMNEYTVALVIHQWTKRKGKRNAGRTTDYRYRGLGYKLNFCPECGRKVE